MTKKKMAEEKRKEIAKKIAKEREAQNLTQKALAEIAGIAHGTVSSIESGNVGMSLEILILLAGALYVPISYLVGEEMDETVKRYEVRNRELEIEIDRLLEEMNRMEDEETERLKEENRILSEYKWVLQRVKATVKDV